MVILEMRVNEQVPAKKMFSRKFSKCKSLKQEVYCKENSLKENRLLWERQKIVLLTLLRRLVK